MILQEYGTAGGNLTFYVEGISNVGNLFVDARGGAPVYGQGGGAHLEQIPGQCPNPKDPSRVLMMAEYPTLILP